MRIGGRMALVGDQPTPYCLWRFGALPHQREVSDHASHPTGSDPTDLGTTAPRISHGHIRSASAASAPIEADYN
jgi:hypothetical protein